MYVLNFSSAMLPASTPAKRPRIFPPRRRINSFWPLSTIRHTKIKGKREQNAAIRRGRWERIIQQSGLDILRILTTLDTQATTKTKPIPHHFIQVTNEEDKNTQRTIVELVTPALLHEAGYRLRRKKIREIFFINTLLIHTLQVFLKKKFEDHR